MYTNPAKSGTLILLFFALAIQSGCRENTHGTTNSAAHDTRTEQIVTYEKEPMISDPQLRSATEFAKNDLAKRLGMDSADLQLLSADKVNWRTSSMGCPEPEMGYLQVISPGILIRIRVSGKLYRYHGARTGNPVLCESKTPEDPAPDGSGLSPQIDDGT